MPGRGGYIAGLDVIDRGAPEAADRLRVIARCGVGVDRVDLEAAREKGIVVTNTRGANSGAVAELTTGLMLSFARMIPVANWDTKAGKPPHIGAHTGGAISAMGWGALPDCLAVLRGEAPAHRVA